MNIYFHFVTLIWTGLMTGISYVNTFNSILYDDKIIKREKELVVGIGILF